MERIERHGNKWRVTRQRAGERYRQTFDTLSAASAFADDLRREEERARQEAARRSTLSTVADVVGEYYERRKRRLELSTQHHYEHVITRHIVAEIGDLAARHLADDPGPLHDFYDELPPTVALHAHQILKPAFQYAVDLRRVDRNPCAIVRPPRPRKQAKLIPLPDEVEKILLAARERSRDDWLFFYLCARLGLRRGEAVGLRWEDVDAGRLVVHVRRSVARVKGGSYVKPPKSGEQRTLHVGKGLFEQIEPFRRDHGWLFPRAYNCPYLAGDRVTAQSTAGRLLAWLAGLGGEVSSPDGSAGTLAATAVGLGRYSASPALRWLERHGFIERDMAPCHIYRIVLTARGREAVHGWDDAARDGMPWFPTTADQKFRSLMRALDMPYTLHSLRHFVATHLYNRKRDWVQLSKFLGHSNPAITMCLYANHVVEVSQVELGEAVMDLFDDLDVVPE